MRNKIQDLNSLVEIRAKLRRQGSVVVFTNGCFDLLHGGHIHLFKAAKKQGDVLVVAVNDDLSVQKLKGPTRPIFPLQERLEVLEAISEIDYVVVFYEETPQKIISVILPDVLVKGGDWKLENVVGRAEVETAGGKVVIVPYLQKHSSSRIIERILNVAKGR